MNSLEAFDRLVELCKYSTSKIFTKPSEIPDMICGYPIEYIRQDLEVLEIIKNKYVHLDFTFIRVSKDYKDYVEAYEKLYLDYNNLYKLTEEDFEKVKEWLERN